MRKLSLSNWRAWSNYFQDIKVDGRLFIYLLLFFSGAETYCGYFIEALNEHPPSMFGFQTMTKTLIIILYIPFMKIIHHTIWVN